MSSAFPPNATDALARNFEFVARQPPRVVVIALDSSVHSGSALSWAIGNLLRPDDTIFLSTVVEVPGINIMPHRTPGELVSKAASVGHATLAPFLDSTLAAGFSRTTMHALLSKSGSSVADTIGDFAVHSKASLIVTGSHGMGAFKRGVLALFGMGSVSTGLMSNNYSHASDSADSPSVTIPILVVPPGADLRMRESAPAVTTTCQERGQAPLKPASSAAAVSASTSPRSMVNDRIDKTPSSTKNADIFEPGPLSHGVSDVLNQQPNASTSKGTQAKAAGLTSGRDAAA